MTRIARNHQILAAVAMVKKAWAMPLRGHSAALRAEPATRSHRLRAAAVIAGEGLVILFLIFLIPALFAGA